MPDFFCPSLKKGIILHKVLLDCQSGKNRSEIIIESIFRLVLKGLRKYFRNQNTLSTHRGSRISSSKPCCQAQIIFIWG